MSNTPQSPRPMSALEATEMLAAEVWRGDRPGEAFGVAGLNSERAVRERLQKIRLELEGQPEEHALIGRQVADLDFAVASTSVIRGRTETLVATLHPGTYVSTAELLAVPRIPGLFAIRCLLVQSIGARLGWWTGRGPEIRDARIAKALYGDISVVRWGRYRGLVEASESLYRSGRWREAAKSALESDRLVRTPSALLRAAGALTKSGELESALWSVRAALLEPRSTFENPRVVEKAKSLETRLRALVEGHAAPPMGEAEARRLVGDLGDAPLPAGEKTSARPEESRRSDAAAKAKAKEGLLSVAATPVLRRADQRRASTLVERSSKRSSRSVEAGQGSVRPPPLPGRAMSPEGSVHVGPPSSSASVQPSEVDEDVGALPSAITAIAPPTRAIAPRRARSESQPPTALIRDPALMPRGGSSGLKPSGRLRAVSAKNEDAVARGIASVGIDEPSVSDDRVAEEPTDAIREERLVGSILLGRPLVSVAREETERIRDRRRHRAG